MIRALADRRQVFGRAGLTATGECPVA